MNASESILKFLKDLDDLLGSQSISQEMLLYLIGGSAITLCYDSENRTVDFDLIDPPKILEKIGGIDSALCRKHHFHVSALSEINFSVPEDWKSRCQPLTASFKHFKVMIACLEDIILGKISRLEPKDFEDIFSLHEKNLLDAKKLLQRLKENKKELRDIRYRNNAILFFQEVFRKKLIFKKGVPVLK